jgi:hypothetical protein
MKLDPGMHIGMHLVSFGKPGVTHIKKEDTPTKSRYATRFLPYITMERIASTYAKSVAIDRCCSKKWLQHVNI